MESHQNHETKQCTPSFAPSPIRSRSRRAHFLTRHLHTKSFPTQSQTTPAAPNPPPSIRRPPFSTAPSLSPEFPLFRLIGHSQSYFLCLSDLLGVQQCHTRAGNLRPSEKGGSMTKCQPHAACHQRSIFRRVWSAAHLNISSTRPYKSPPAKVHNPRDRSNALRPPDIYEMISNFVTRRFPVSFPSFPGASCHRLLLLIIFRLCLELVC